MMELLDLPIPVQAGDTVHVPAAVYLPCGRRIRTGDYTVLAADLTPPRHRHHGRYRLTIEATPDCSGLPETHRPGSEYRTRRGLGVPHCARPSRFYLYPGDFTQYAGGEESVIADGHVQTT